MADKYDKNISLTTTDMNVQFFANEEKLVDPDSRVFFDKEEYMENHPNPHHNHERDRDHDHDDDYGLDDDMDKYKKPMGNVFQQSKSGGLSEDYKKPAEKSHRASDTDASEGVGKKTLNSENIDPEDESNMTKEEMLLRRLDMLRKLGELQEAGVTLSQIYSLNSDYKTMKYEYEVHSNIRSKRNALNWMSGMMVGIVKGIELLNDNVNPFDLKFSGMWSNEVKSDISNYHDTLGEIYEKYTTPGKKMAPELKLFLMLTGSAVSIQMHKGMANFMADKSDVSGDIDKNQNKFEELRKKAMEQQKKTNERFASEHNAAVEKMATMEILKKKEAEMERMMQHNNRERDYQSLLVTDTKSMNTNKSKKDIVRTMEMQRAILEQQARKNNMAREIKDLAEMDRSLSEISSRKSKSKKPTASVESTSKKSSKSTKKSSSSDDDDDDDDDNDDDDTDNRSVASSATYVKNPMANQILGKKNDTVLVRQYEVMDRVSAEKMMSDNTQESYKKPEPKKRGRPSKASIK
jgi:hypothetical protein